MKIRYHIEGGLAHFPGLAAERMIDVDALPPERADDLRQVAERALAAPVPATAVRGADRRVFVVRIDAGRKSRTLRIVEPAGDAAHAALISKLQEG